MTREECIDWLCRLRSFLTQCGMPKEWRTNFHQALSDAIKALEQEPCDVPDINVGNMISRQAVINVIERWLECSDYNEAERHIMRAMQSVLYDSPSVKPQSCEDAVSRQGAIDAANRVIERDTSGNNDVVNAMIAWSAYIKSLPPITPQSKIGHWIFDEILDTHYYCSECNSMGVDYWDYCPNCGAKMEEVEE